MCSLRGRSRREDSRLPQWRVIFSRRSSRSTCKRASSGICETSRQVDGEDTVVEAIRDWWVIVVAVVALVVLVAWLFAARKR